MIKIRTHKAADGTYGYSFPQLAPGMVSWTTATSALGARIQARVWAVKLGLVQALETRSVDRSHRHPGHCADGACFAR